jgi:two-component system chemotaxis response regulator CheB
MSIPRCTMAVIGCSAGGLQALQILIPDLSANLAAPVIVVCHTAGEIGTLCDLIGRKSAIPVLEARERMHAAPGVVYVAPSDYHLLMEPDMRFSLSVDPRVTYSRPSIDVLFESAASACGAAVVGVILTGGNNDGAAGLKSVRDAGGLGIIQRPDSAEVASMPAAALALAGADHCVTLAEIGPLLNSLCTP